MVTKSKRNDTFIKWFKNNALDYIASGLSLMGILYFFMSGIYTLQLDFSGNVLSGFINPMLMKSLDVITKFASVLLIGFATTYYKNRQRNIKRKTYKLLKRLRKKKTGIDLIKELEDTLGIGEDAAIGCEVDEVDMVYLDGVDSSEEEFEVLIDTDGIVELEEDIVE